MTRSRDPGELRKRRDEIRDELASLGDLRPGSLVGRYRKCGKPTCHCAREEGGGHGPSWSLTRAVGGRTRTRIIPPAAVPQTRAQIAEYGRLRRLTGELVEVSEGLCETLLAGSGDASSETAKKGA
jgi:hypothetical protein